MSSFTSAVLIGLSKLLGSAAAPGLGWRSRSSCPGGVSHVFTGIAVHLQALVHATTGPLATPLARAANERQRVSHANGARRRSGVRESVRGSPRAKPLRK